LRLNFLCESDSALTVNGKKNNLKREDFDALADLREIPHKVRYERFDGKLKQIGMVVNTSMMPGEFKEKLAGMLAARYARLEIRNSWS